MRGRLGPGASFQGKAAAAYTERAPQLRNGLEMDVLNAEIEPLKRCFGGLSGVLAAKGVSGARPAAAVVESLFDSLLADLELQIAYLRLPRRIGELPLEILRAAAPIGRDLR